MQTGKERLETSTPATTLLNKASEDLMKWRFEGRYADWNLRRGVSELYLIALTNLDCNYGRTAVRLHN